MKDDTAFILECPGCQTRYELPVAIPEDGRKVRCARCAHVWLARPDDAVLPWGDDSDQDIIFRELEPDAEAEQGDEQGESPRLEAETARGGSQSGPEEEEEDEVAFAATAAAQADEAGEAGPEEAESAGSGFAGELSEAGLTEADAEGAEAAASRPPETVSAGPEDDAETDDAEETESAGFAGDAGTEAEALFASAPEAEAETDIEAEADADAAGAFAAEVAVEDTGEEFAEAGPAGEEAGPEAALEAVFAPQDAPTEDRPPSAGEEGQGEEEDEYEGGQGEEEADTVTAFYGDEPEDAAPAGDTGTERIVVAGARRRLPFSAAAAAGWVALCLGLFGLGVVAVTQRASIVRAMPASAWAYETFGMPVNVRGLDFRDVAYSWGTDAGEVVLEVHGDIVNITDAAVEVPTVVLGLRNGDGTEIYRWEDAVMDEPLAADARATFAVRIPAPPEATESVQVRFAGPR